MKRVKKKIANAKKKNYSKCTVVMKFLGIIYLLLRCIDKAVDVLVKITTHFYFTIVKLYEKENIS
jgi:hypothetical protein